MLDLCVQVKCTYSICNSQPTRIVITDFCPGGVYCSTDEVAFDLSGSAMDSLAVPGLESTLRDFGQYDIQYMRYRLWSRSPCLDPACCPQTGTRKKRKNFGFLQAHSRCRSSLLHQCETLVTPAAASFVRLQCVCVCVCVCVYYCNRVPCDYVGQNVAFAVDAGSSPYWLSFAVRYEGGPGDIESVMIRQVTNYMPAAAAPNISLQ